MEYSDYQTAEGNTLPRKFEATNSETNLKVVVDEWPNLPKPRHD